MWENRIIVRSAQLPLVTGAQNTSSGFFFQAEDGIRDWSVTGVQTCALPISAACRPAELPRPLAELAAAARPWAAASECGDGRRAVAGDDAQLLRRRRAGGGPPCGAAPGGAGGEDRKSVV